MKFLRAFVFLICLLASFVVFSQTSVQFNFGSSQFNVSQYTNSLVRLQGYSYNVNGTMTILGSPIYQYTDVNGSTTFSNLDGGYTRGFYQWKVIPFSQQPGLLNPPDVPVNSGWIQVTSTNLGLISSTLIGVTGVPTWGGTGAAYNTQTSDQRYAPSSSSLSNYVQIGQLISTSNSIVALIPSTNGLASTNFVNSQIQSATNQLASTNYVNGQGFVTSAVTNGLATTNQLNNYTPITSFTAGTNSVATNAYAQLIATNAALVSALAIQNSNLLVTINASSNLLANTKQPASLILSNLSATGAFTNLLTAGTNVVISTNINGNTIYINAVNQTFLTNGINTAAFQPASAFLATNVLPALTNGFVSANVTNGLASIAYVNSSIAASGAFTNTLAAGTNAIFSTNANTVYVNVPNQTFLTNGHTSLVFTNPSAVLYTNALPALTNGFVGAGITNGFITTANVQSILASSNYFSQFIVAGTNVLITSNFSGNTIYINATNQTFLTNGLVTAAITNGLVGANITNGLASTGYVANALSPYALIGSLTAATNSLWTNSVANFYPLSNPSNYVNQAALNGTNTALINALTATNAALLNSISATNTANLIITTNLVVASTNGGNIVFTNNPQFVNAITNPALFVASTNGNAFGLSISNYAGFWTKTNFLCTTNVIGIVGNGGGTYLFNGSTTWTNPFATNYSILLSAGNYYLQSNAVSLYQSTNVINWTVVSGASPAPVGSWGSKWGMDGVQFIGWLYSTNMNYQITNQAMILINKYAVNPTNGTTPSVVTNIANYLIGVSNVGSVFTNGNTGVGQIAYSTNVAPGYFWAAAPSGGSGVTNAYYTNTATVVVSGVNLAIGTNNFGAGSGNYIANLNGFGTNTTLITPTLSVVLGTGLKSFQFGGNTVSGAYSSILGGIGNSSTTYADYDSILGGATNSITSGGISSFYDVIAGGTLNTISTAYYAGIVAGKNNYIYQGNSGILDASFIGAGQSNSIYGDESFIGGGLNNYIGSAGDYSAIPSGQNNRAMGVNSFAAGYYASATNGSFVWSDSSTNDYFSSKTNNSFIVRASNGFGINTNYSGTNALKVVGNVDSTVGFSVNGVPVGGGNQVFWITNQTSALPSAIRPAICYTFSGGQFIKTNSTLDTNGWYQNIADHP